MLMTANSAEKIYTVTSGQTDVIEDRPHRVVYIQIITVVPSLPATSELFNQADYY